MEDDPFDFESDALLATSPVVAPNKRKKVIGLDDLLVDHYKEKNRVIERQSKLAKTKKTYNSDDEEDGRVAKLSKYVNECHEKMTQLSDEDDVSIWGLQVFGNQKSPPSFVFSDLSSCSFFRSFLNHEANSLVELSTESGEIFFEGLLTNGWLLKLVKKCGKVEKSIATWTFHLMLYSTKEVLRSAAVNFWCAILLLKNEGDSSSLKIDWLPTYLELKNALETYGYLLDLPKKILVILKWTLEEFAFYFLDIGSRRIVGCYNPSFVRSTTIRPISRFTRMYAIFNHFFKDEEWSASCTNIAKSIASRVPLDINCLRAVECIPSLSLHAKQLRSTTAFRILLGFFDKVEDEEEVIRQLTLINLKDKSCDLFRIYIYLVLTENWFLYDPVMKEKTLLSEMWGLFLRNCCCQINITDTRSYASKVRSKASYLLQATSETLV